MSIRTFFDLSLPIFGGHAKKPTATSVADVVPHAAALATEEAGPVNIKLAEPTRAPAEIVVAEVPAGTQLTWAWQVAIYVILVLSIFSSRFLDLYRAGVLDEFRVDGPYMLFTAIASLLAFPIVYDRAQLTRGRPVLVQIGVIFAAGMGWEKLIATAIGK